MSLPRRTFLTAAGTTALGAFAGGTPLASGGREPAGEPGGSCRPFAERAKTEKTPRRRKKLAVVTTVYRCRSHAYHIAGRFIHGYTLDGRHHQPQHEVVSMFVEQVGDDDLSRGLAKRFGFRHAKSIREALTLGGEKIAVDAVLLIGEHGDYPLNKYGQQLYPRHRMFSDIVAEFRRSGRSVPVFNDKHLSYGWAKAEEMVRWSRELNFPLQAGSSLPVTWRRPETELPLETEIEEALVVAFSDPERYGFHALETLQCHVERRKGGETGLRSVRALTGEAVWQAAEKKVWSPELFDAALGRSRSINIGNPRHNVADPHAYLLEYRDGLRATVLLLTEHVADFTFAAKLRGREEPVSTLHYLPEPPGAKYFDALVHNIERMFAAGRAVIPIERTLLVSGALEALLHSKFEDSKPLETPQLNVAYRAPKDSGYIRGPVDRTGQRAAQGHSS